MIGTTRSRRLCAGLVGVVLLMAVAGCTVGTTSIPAGERLQFILCPADGPPTGFWILGPEAQYLRFEVTSSDATQPLDATGLFGNLDGNGDVLDFGMVWDGTKSAGPKQIDLRRTGYRQFFLRISTGFNGPVSQTTHVDWMLTALDANGNDVGLTCTG